MSQPSRPTKVLHVFGRMQRGGAELRTVEVLRHLDPAQFELHFSTLSGLPGELDDEIRRLGGKVHPVRLDWFFAGRFRKLIRREGITVVHSHVHYSSGFILLCAAVAGVMIRIAHFRSTGDGQPDTVRRRGQRLLLRWFVDLFATDILAVSEGALEASWPRWHSDRRCQVVYNGLDTAAYAVTPDPKGVREEFGLPHDCPLCIHVGRMDLPKNHERLIRIFSELVRRRPDVRLLLVGRGGTHIEQQVRAIVAELKLEKHVVIAGERRDVPRLLLAANLLLLPSIREGLPGAVLEACAAGIPVVGSDVPGTVEIARHMPGVQHLSLALRDEAWAEIALSSLDNQLNQTRICEIQPLLGSVFHIDQCVKTLSAVWRRGC